MDNYPEREISLLYQKSFNCILYEMSMVVCIAANVNQRLLTHISFKSLTGNSDNILSFNLPVSLNPDLLNMVSGGKLPLSDPVF
jgi:hypothetical protein